MDRADPIREKEGRAPLRLPDGSPSRLSIDRPRRGDREERERREFGEEEYSLDATEWEWELTEARRLRLERERLRFAAPKPPPGRLDPLRLDERLFPSLEPLRRSGGRCSSSAPCELPLLPTVIDCRRLF